MKMSAEKTVMMHTRSQDETSSTTQEEVTACSLQIQVSTSELWVQIPDQPGS